MSDARRPEAAGSEAGALVAQGDRAALAAMTEDADQFLQEAGIWGLGQLRDARDLPRLAALLGDAYVQEEAQAALIAFGPAAEPVLVRALDDLRGSGALCALEALRAVGGPAAVDALTRCPRDGDESVRSWTIEALSEIGNAAHPAPGRRCAVTPPSRPIRT